MTKCLITYNKFITNKSGINFSVEGLKYIDKKLVDIKPLGFNQVQLRTEALALSDKISIQGVQPKLSAKLNVKNGNFEIVEKRGTYIIKVQVPDRLQMPENEDLTMKMASIIGVDVPIHGLINDSGNALNYFIKRFDRHGQKSKFSVEDFAQLSEKTSATKYDASTELLIKIVDDYCTFPAIEKVKLFKRLLFSFMVGNEDMHLKNFSLITKKGKTYLSPAYDLINSTLIMTSTKEEMALPIMGTKARFKLHHFKDYLGLDKMKIQPKIVNKIINNIQSAKPVWIELINSSFLNDDLKSDYIDILNKRFKRLFS